MKLRDCVFKVLRTQLLEFLVYVSNMMSKLNNQEKQINEQTKYYFYYVKTNVLKLVRKTTFKKVEYPMCQTSWGKIRIVGLENNRKQVERLLLSTYQPEGLFSDVKNIYADISILLKIAKSLHKAHDVASSINTRKILHIIKFLMQAINIIQNGATVSTLITCFIDFHLAINENTWKAEMLEQVCLASLSLLLPAPLFEIIKRLQVFSHSKLVDDISGIHKFISLILEGIRWLLNSIRAVVTIPTPLEEFISKFFQFCESHSQHFLLFEIKSVVEKERKNPKLLMTSSFRDRIVNLHEKVEASNIKDWAKKSSSVQSMLTDLTLLYRRVKAFLHSGRQEPACFILEGPPGCGKSVALNYLVDLLGKTKYVHTVKDSMEGKDFYDAYNDEEIFMMDDVGQQSISQWREFIFWVSEVKYPLQCAALEYKDSKFFNSEIILATTNNFMNLRGGLTKQDGISNIEALWRRAFVFDFSTVKFIDGEYSGTIYLRSFQQETCVSEAGFINDVPRHLKNKMSILHPDKAFDYRKFKLDTSDPHNKFRMGLWMASIVTMIQKNNKLNKQTNVTQEEDKQEAQALLQRIEEYQYTPESREFVVGPFGFKCSLILNILYEILQNTFLSIFDSFLSWDWLSLFLCIFVIVIFTIIFSFVRNKCSSEYTSENDLDVVLKNATTSHPTTHSKVAKSLVYLSYNKDDGTESKCIGLASGHCIVTTAHSLHNSSVVSIYKDNKYSHCIYDKLKYQVVYNNLIEDVVILSLPKNIAAVFSNLHHFFSQSHKGDKVLSLVVPTGTIEIGTPLSGCLPANSCVYTTNLRDQWKGFTHVITNEDHFYNFRASGLCGSVLMNNSYIVGMHVAGDASANIGVSKLFSQQTIDEIQQILAADVDFYIGNMSDKIIENSSVLKLEQKSKVHVGNTSHLRPTEIYGIYPVSREPANLEVYGKHTIKDVAKKSFGFTTYIHTEALQFGKEWLKHELRNFRFYQLNEEEIVCGNKLLAGLNKKSSNGFANSRNKEDYINFDLKSFTPLLRANLQEMKEGILNGKPPWHYFYWIEALKDELRNVEKQGVPRSFRVGTIQHQVLMKQYFGCLVQYLMERRDENFIMVGCNPIKEWPRMYTKLQQCKGVFAGDIAKWDGSMNNMVQDAIKEIIEDKCGGNEIVSFLLEQAIRSIVHVSDDVYITTHSMPSGHYLTAILNSLVNRFYSALWYYEVMTQHGKQPTISHFNHNIIDFVYGDDKLVGVKSHTDILNAITMRQYFEFLNMGFTDSLKNPITKPFESLDDVTFLKRFFRYNFKLNRIVCPLDLRTLQNSLSFYDNTKDYQVVVEAKILNYFREMFLHPNYTELADDFEKRLREYNLDYCRFSDEYLIDMYNRSMEDGFDPSIFYWGHVQY